LAAGTTSLPDVTASVLERQPGIDRLLLIADQWEEIYTQCSDERRRHRFIDLVLDGAEKGRLSVVLTLRGDFVGRALSYRPLADRLQDRQVNLGPMTREELGEVIVVPAQRVGLTFETGLVERILDDVVDQPGHLPLLEFAERVTMTVTPVLADQLEDAGAAERLRRFLGAPAIRDIGDCTYKAQELSVRRVTWHAGGMDPPVLTIVTTVPIIQLKASSFVERGIADLAHA